MTEPTNTINDAAKKIETEFKNFLSKDSSQFYYITITIIFFILFALFSWIYSRLSLQQKSCDRLEMLYPNQMGNSFMNSICSVKSEAKDNFDDNYKSLTNNFYVKSAYNCCCGDGYKNNFVDVCALQKCINTGFRCLDFEIYSLNNKPIVAASTANNNSIKETYNYIPLDKVFQELNRLSFNSEETQCYNDPMFLHFRIMSENKIIFDLMADYIEQHLNKDPQDVNSYLVKFEHESQILIKPLKNFSRKFIIMIHANPNNNLITSTKLNDYVNLISGGPNLKMYRYSQLVSYGEYNPLLIDEVKRSLVLVLPDINNKLLNYDFLLPQSNGCQFMCMKFQNMDNYLVSYIEMFKDNGNYSFVLKPRNVRKDKFKQYNRPDGIVNAPTSTEALTDVLIGMTSADEVQSGAQALALETVDKRQELNQIETNPNGGQVGGQ
jgi:hypothetical protein